MEKHNLNRVLDVGCGTGRLVRFLRQQGYAAYGCDKEKVALKLARQINEPKIIKNASATKLPFRENSFELVTAINVIEHLSTSEMSKFLRETYRILIPHGFIFIIAPNFSSPLRFVQGRAWFGYEDPTHIRFDSPRTISNLLRKNNFNQIQFQFQSSTYDAAKIEATPILSRLPQQIKTVLNFLLFTTPLTHLRNGFWVAAQK